MEAILAVTNTAEVEVKIRPEKNSDPYGIWIHDLDVTGAAQCSGAAVQRWATKPTDSLLLCWLQINSRSRLVGQLVERWLVS